MCEYAENISEDLFPSVAEIGKLSDRYTELINRKMRQLLTFQEKKSIV